MMPYTKNLSYFATICATLLFVLSGCATKRVPPTHYYTISSVTPGIEKQRVENPRFDTLRISTAHSSRMNQSTQIYYQNKNFQREPYAYSRWYDSVDTMMQNKLLTAIKSANIAHTVLPAATSADTTMVLETDTIEFIQDFSRGGKCVAKIAMLATLIDNKTGKSHGSRLFRAKKPCRSYDAPGGVAALNDAANTITLELIGWLEETDGGN